MLLSVLHKCNKYDGSRSGRYDDDDDNVLGCVTFPSSYMMKMIKNIREDVNGFSHRHETPGYFFCN